eukprot:TRINITY_DN2605_c0_g1_i1.p1 TRINITY_DN2605_c0_g1~~TRINITY_DN2605_c0_g1_i1.p1  ORF type:complete len:155 (+),score=72.00 TRINITY_DN2605_c0_g1_i1:449-913(+)
MASIVDVGASNTGDAQEAESVLMELAEQLAVHVVASRPHYLTRDVVPQDVLQHERDILQSQASAAGKPAKVVEKMVEGRLRKFYEDVVLMEQKFYVDEGKTVQQVMAAAAKTLGLDPQKGLRVRNFIRWEVGEGMERQEKKIVAEVAAAISASA